MTVFYLARSNDAGEPGTRVGFTVSKALGEAVQRNRMRRRLREAVRLQGSLQAINADIVINPKRTLISAEFVALQKEVARAFEVIEKSLTSKKEKPRT
jgi:ribonuclease P protein component